MWKGAPQEFTFETFLNDTVSLSFDKLYMQINKKHCEKQYGLGRTFATIFADLTFRTKLNSITNEAAFKARIIIYSDFF